MTAPDAILALNDQLKGWLFDHALPLWFEAGIDRSRGGFAERIALDGRAVDGPRRVRVAARQTWVFATVGALGWTGPWREAVVLGARALETFARPDGLYGILADADGRLIDETPAPYEQAFALLAAANAWQPNAANDWRFIPGGLKAHVSCIIEVPAGGCSIE